MLQLGNVCYSRAQDLETHIAADKGLTIAGCGEDGLCDIFTVAVVGVCADLLVGT